MAFAAGVGMMHAQTDTLPSKMKDMNWRVGMSLGGDAVVPTNAYLKGEYPGGKMIGAAFGVHLQGDFSYNPKSLTGRLYKGLYQGIGVDVRTFYNPGKLGTPVSLYVYQGMPFAWLTPKVTLGYEWQFGAAMGWQHIYNPVTSPYNTAVSTRITAHMNVGLKVNYQFDKHWQFNCGWSVMHYSNANTRQPNQGINMTGVTMGVSYTHDEWKEPEGATREMIEENLQDRRLYVDILTYTGQRKKVKFNKGGHDQDNVYEGSFNVSGIRVGPMWKCNRFVAVGGQLDFRYDESAGVEPIGQYAPGEIITNYTCPSSAFKQMSLGVMGCAELTMPLFAVNVALGVNALRPDGEKIFYQALSVKLSPHPRFYINAGYQLSDFKLPQNLCLGVGIRI